ncbi:DUF2726 domain-containing protein [Gymnodinialimonas ceratoperidinii]|uniref:DUF2726 domain-containing protein n=1 Tax=Gymnodinialimonas ceratoperidinii TaxID=2856823 RepID=A0A8F6TZX2_9RHOB|nr:DUF2726 domain-containing protein [Gymnodinialimonas ceratoperidinii]QXT40786.1 DUF2726 domain-containing protein [Gymnodinialimonas ceratoperidinii]
MAGLFHDGTQHAGLGLMLSFLAQVSTIVLIGAYGCMIAFVIVVSTVAMKHKEKLAEAEHALAEEKAKNARLFSHGADLIQRVGWRKQRLMNRPEYHLFRELERLVAQSSRGYRVFTQVSCGEFLEVAYRADLKDIAQEASHCLNRKRVDFLLIDRVGNPVCAIEYQGDGHYQGSAHGRDHAKRVACHAAGIRFLEVAAGGLTAGQRRDLRDLLGLKDAIAAE